MARVSSTQWVVIGRGRAGSGLSRWLGRRRAAEFSLQRPQNVLIAIPDDALEDWAAELARVRASWRGWCFLHVSGARPSAVLSPLRARGAATGSLHPMMTFPEKGREVSPKGVVFSLEGDLRARQTAADLVRGWGGQLLELSPKAKMAYHFAATLVGPGAVVAMAAAEKALRSNGLRGRNLALAREGLVRLLAATAANLGAGKTAEAWTGPIARKDRTTLELHWQVADSAELRGYYAGLVGTARRLLP